MEGVLPGLWLPEAPRLVLPRELLRQPLGRWKRFRARTLAEEWVFAAPTFVADAASIFSSTGTTKTATVTGQAGDILVAGCVMEGSSETFNVPTNDGAALTWTQRQLDNATASITRLGVWTATLDTSRTIVVTGHISNGTINRWGIVTRAWRGSAGVGASSIAVADTTTPWSVGVTTTQDNSALDWISGDWNAVAGARTALVTGVGAFTERTAVDTSTIYYVEGGYHADVGTAGAKTVGVSAPAAQKWQGIVVEIKGTAGAVKISRPRRSNTSVQHSSTW